MLSTYILFVGRDSSAGIVTGYGMDGPGIESPVDAIFFVLAQTGPVAYPAPYTMGTWSFLGGKAAGAWR